MLHLLIELSKYIMILLFLIYTLEAFWVLRYDANSNKPMHLYNSQNRLMFYIHALAFLVLYLTTQKIEVLGFYLMQVVLFGATLILYRIFYKNASRLLINNMCMLMCIGMIILTRLSYEKALKQYVFMVAGLVIMMLFPLILSSTSSLFRRLGWLYAIVGVLALASVTVLGKIENGAKLSISFGGFSLQPSEFVKIIFVFFVASMLYMRQDFKRVLITAGGAGLFLLVLAASKDLGCALIFYVAFLAMVYVAAKKPLYLAIGLGAVMVAAVLGYMVFSHVQVRVAAWQDPLADPTNNGYQISRSLFGIGTGGWFGLGLSQGAPELIPYVEKDVIFSAISEEMGGIFALCLIAVCISCFLIIFNISMRLKDKFYRLVALGLGCIYAMQVFLTVGGMIKFIPSTGVTLPLVSYGGSSLISTVLLFGIIQALYLMQAKNQAQEEVSARQGAEEEGRSSQKNRETAVNPETFSALDIARSVRDDREPDSVIGEDVARIMRDDDERNSEDSIGEDVTRIMRESRNPESIIGEDVARIMRAESEAAGLPRRMGTGTEAASTPRHMGAGTEAASMPRHMRTETAAADTSWRMGAESAADMPRRMQPETSAADPPRRFRTDRKPEESTVTRRTLEADLADSVAQILAQNAQEDKKGGGRS